MAKKYSVIKSNEKLRKAIIDRIESLGLNQRDVMRDAAEKGYKLPIDMLNRYLTKGDTRGTLREEQIVWLATRYGVYLQLKIGKPVITPPNKLSYEVGEYNEEEALRILNQLFPKK